MISEPGPKDIRAKVLACRIPKIQVSQFVPGEAIPSSVIPRAGNQIVQVTRVSLLQDFISFYGPIKVFLIPPSRNMHCRYCDFPELINQSLLLPELIVIRVVNEVIPGWQLAVKEFRICVRKRA